jgi:hypothetical protein
MANLNLVTVGLLAGAGYLLYNYFGLPDSSSSPAVPPAPPNPATPAPLPPPTPPDIKSLILGQSKIGPNELRNSDIWNFYYNHIRGVEAPAPEDLFPDVPRRNVTIDEWWAAMRSKGFSGLRRRGLGCCGPVNPYVPEPGRGRLCS